MDNFVVLHFEKHGKPTGGSLGNHIDRIEGKEYSYRHADKSLRHLNVDYSVNELTDMDYNEAILHRVEQGYTKSKKIRESAIYSVNVMLSASHDKMKEIEKDPALFKKWVEENYAFCEENFGKENIVRFTLHRDEKTPHIHCVFVPITPDGRLSAKDFIGTGAKLEKFQSSYADAMAQFGLRRGVSSDRTHQTTAEYRRRENLKIEDAQQLHQQIDSLNKINVLTGLNNLKADLHAGVNDLLLKQYDKLETEQKEHIKELKRIKSNNQTLNIEKKFIPMEEIEDIANNTNLIDYFLHLADRGMLIFEKRSGKEFIFTDEAKTQKISVSERGWQDFKTGEKGQIFKAIQKFEKLETWIEAVRWAKNSQTTISTQYAEIRQKTASEMSNIGDKYNITQIKKPSAGKLADYFYSRGISLATLREYTKQVHYQLGDKHAYGIGIENINGGYDLRLPFENGKIKLNQSSISVNIPPTASSIVIVEGMTDMLSMIEYLKVSGKNYKNIGFVCLNSVSNSQIFLDYITNKPELQNRNFFMLLDGDEAGEKATKVIEKTLQEKGCSVMDYRENIGIFKGGYNDVNEFLVNHVVNKQPKPTKIDPALEEAQRRQKETQERKNKLTPPKPPQTPKRGIRR